MYYLNLNKHASHGHEFEKVNLMTIKSSKGFHDLLVCRNCAMKGRSYSLGEIRISNIYKKERVFNCSKRKPIVLPKRVKITYCNAAGQQFKNLSPGTEHDVINTPVGKEHLKEGVWVMGVGEPVRILPDEYEEIS